MLRSTRIGYGSVGADRDLEDHHTTDRGSTSRLRIHRWYAGNLSGREDLAADTHGTYLRRHHIVDGDTPIGWILADMSPGVIAAVRETQLPPWSRP